MSDTADGIDIRDLKLSPQQNVIQDKVPKLQSPNEHHHKNVQHACHVEKGREVEAIYSYGTPFNESTFQHQDLQDHDLHRKRHIDIAKEPTAALDTEQVMSSNDHEEQPQTHILLRSYNRYRIFFHLFFWVIFTGWWVAGLVLHVHDPLSSNTGWLKPFLLWLGITLRIVFFHVPINVLTKPIGWAWGATSVRSTELLPDRAKTPLAALLTVSIFLIGGFVSPESEDNTRDNRAVCTYSWSLCAPKVEAETPFEEIHPSDVF